jgi:hypothetical protein
MVVEMGAFTIFLDGEERPGFLIYGLKPPVNEDFPEFPTSVWHGYQSVKKRILFGNKWRVLMWEVALDRVHDTAGVAASIDATLQVLLDAGCVAAWVAVEGHFCDPPSLFLPECMSGGVFAVKTVGGISEHAFGSSGGLRPIADAVLLEARSETYSLSAAE